MTIEEQLDLAHRNSYYIIINKVPVEDIIMSIYPYVMHNPGEKIKKKTVINLLNYFENMEEYEKCKKIKKHIDDNFKQ
tara:strand:+ start:73 stop:306 length:234 start_codon:yes stop_codon:yes gene_type:complete